MYNFQEIMKPFWTGNTISKESLLMIKNTDSPPASNLLFKPTKILRVESARLDKVFIENRDWIHKDGKIKLCPESNIPFMFKDEMYPTHSESNNSQIKRGGGKVSFHEGHFFHDRQIVITYEHNQHWLGPKPLYSENQLPNVINKLKLGNELKLILYGDSISVGSNSSGVSGAPPYLPNWGTLLSEKLRKSYNANILMTNSSISGVNSEWGRDNVDLLVTQHRPDLTIVAFGMNDGTEGIKPERFQSNIDYIIKHIKNNQLKSEIILVSPTLANPETFFSGNQVYYKSALEDLVQPGIALADMTGVHQELLKYKKFQDMTGNNINHPNDFLVRWYAQFICGMLFEE